LGPQSRGGEQNRRGINMARNFIQPGDTLTFAAPLGGVTAGGAYLIGKLLVVAQNTAAEGAPFQGKRVGVFTLPKATGQAWTVGARIHWDDTAKKCTTTATSNQLVGVAVADAGSADDTGTVLLDGVVRLDAAS
jgi:predicted RecA/RadA family phage recombinase